MYAGRVCWRVCPGRGAARPGHRAQMASNVIVAHGRLSWSRGSIGAHGNLQAGAANARPRRHADSPGQADQPRFPDARMPLQNFSTCCCLHCGGYDGSKRADLRCARCLAAAFFELSIPQQRRLRRLSKLLHRSGENDKRYRRHHPASQPGASLPVLILTIPNNPILQSRGQPDCNCGATLAHTGMCVHVEESRKTCDSVFFHRICN
jgi:hypothetical protein